MSTFNASDIVDKTLIAKIPLNAYTRPSTSSKVYATYKAGQTVGVVYSWIESGSNLYWMFYNGKKVPYYVPHAEGKFSISSLKDQGVKTTAQKTKEAEEANKTTGEKLSEVAVDFATYLKWILIAALVVFLIYEGYKSGLLNKILKK